MSTGGKRYNLGIDIEFTNPDTASLDRLEQDLRNIENTLSSVAQASSNAGQEIRDALSQGTGVAKEQAEDYQKASQSLEEWGNSSQNLNSQLEEQNQKVQQLSNSKERNNQVTEENVNAFRQQQRQADNLIQSLEQYDQTLRKNQKTESLVGDMSRKYNLSERQVQQLNSELRENGVLLSRNEKNNKQLERSVLEVAEAHNLNENQTKQLSQSMKKYENDMGSVGNATKKTKSTIGNFGESLKTALHAISIWGIGTQMIYGFKRSIEETIQVLVEIDRQMVSLRKVMNHTLTDFNEMKSAAIDLGVEYAKSADSVIEGMSRWAKQGKDQLETIELTRSALLAANVAEMDAANAVDYLTSATLQFNKASSESIEIVDKWNEVANNYATTGTALAESIKESGAAARAANISMDHLIGMTTALTASTAKSGSRVGNALKTMLSRVRGSGEETEESLGKVEDALSNVGIALRVNQNTYRDTTHVLSDLASRWDTLNEVQQNNIAYALGGRRRYSDVISLIENWDIALDATNTSMNSLNSAMQENEEYMKGLPAQLEKTSAVADKLRNTLGEAGLEGAILNSTKAIRAALRTIDDYIVGLTNMSKELKVFLGILVGGGLVAGVYKFVTSIKALNAALTAFSLNPTIIGFTALVGAINSAIVIRGRHNKILEEAQTARGQLNAITSESIELTQTEINRTEELIEKYKEMSQAALDALDKTQVGSSFWDAIQGNREYNDIKKELEKAMPDLADGYDGREILQAVYEEMNNYKEELEETTNATIKRAEETRNLTEQHRAENQALKEKYKTYKELSNIDNRTADQSQRLEGVVNDLQREFSTLNYGDFDKKLKELVSESREQFDIGGSFLEETREQIQEDREMLERDISRLGDKRVEYAREITQLEKELAGLEEGTGEYFDTRDSLTKLEDNLRNVREIKEQANIEVENIEEALDRLDLEFGTGVISGDSKKEKEVEKAIMSTVDYWQSAISEGISNAFEDTDNFKGLVDGLGKTLASTLSSALTLEIDEDGEMLNEMQKHLGEMLNLDLSQSKEAIRELSNELAGILNAFVNEDMSIGNTILSGAGSVTDTMGIPVVGTLLDTFGNIGESIWGEVTGGEQKQLAKDMNEKIKETEKNLAEFNITAKGTNAEIKNTASLWEKVWGGDSWSVKNLEEAEDSLKKIKSSLERVSELASSALSGFKESLTNNMDYASFRQQFDNSIGQALKDAIVNKTLEAFAMQDEIKAFAGEVEKALADGVVTDEEMELLQKRYDNVQEVAQKTFKSTQKLFQEFDGLGLETEMVQNREQTYQSGNTQNITYHQQYNVHAGAMLGEEEDAERFVRYIEPYVAEVQARNSGN